MPLPPRYSTPRPPGRSWAPYGVGRGELPSLSSSPLSPVVWKSQHVIIQANYWRAQIEEEN